MQCNKCGAKLEDKDKYCYSCGEKAIRTKKTMNRIGAQYSDLDRPDHSTAALLIVSLLSCALPSLVLAVIALVKSDRILKNTLADNLAAAYQAKRTADKLTRIGWLIFGCYALIAVIILIVCFKWMLNEV